MSQSTLVTAGGSEEPRSPGVEFMRCCRRGCRYAPVSTCYSFAAKTVHQQKSSRPPVPISNATKRSFLGSPAEQPPAALAAEGCHRCHLHPEEAEYP